MNNLSGGYIMVDLNSPNKVKQLEKAAALNKPLLVYYADGTTEWGKVAVTYETVDDVEIPTYHITTANGFVAVEADGDVSTRPLIVEGDGAKDSSTPEGVTLTYCKWSLSGTHLMIVCAGNVANATEIANDSYLAVYPLPKFILDKIYPVWDSRNIENKTTTFIADNWGTQTASITLVKTSTALGIRKTGGGTFTLTANRAFRIQFDLVIDTD